MKKSALPANHWFFGVRWPCDHKIPLTSHPIHRNGSDFTGPSGSSADQRTSECGSASSSCCRVSGTVAGHASAHPAPCVPPTPRTNNRRGTTSVLRGGEGIHIDRVYGRLGRYAPASVSWLSSISTAVSPVLLAPKSLRIASRSPPQHSSHASAAIASSPAE